CGRQYNYDVYAMDYW
nr:immunoglobulin heavy chain junction region [Mus musculus]MBK4188766.1 immunoglobulin heavy chain junction region [Mus musculus]